MQTGFDFPRWDQIAWCLVTAAWLTIEIIGAVNKSDRTFTNLVFNVLRWWPLRMIAWVTLGWHFKVFG